MGPQPAVPEAFRAPGEPLWEDCRNSLGIARLLVHERRSDRLIATACRMAVETGCRVALSRAGFAYDGDLATALALLQAPDRLCVEPPGLGGRDLLTLAEQRVSWLSSWLRVESPDRSWSC